ncbi:MAG: ImmA/IrrE family metallo-endopeptidase [Bacteroidetes bacterium]|nr:ImmA/IrrE family metallo-endopeptidase [Bacteroidota bacterium]
MIEDWKIILYVNQLRDAVSLNYNERIDDINLVIKKAGYQYFEDHFGNDFSGLSKCISAGHYAIGFNKDHFWSEKFRRFTIAHELGHLSIPEHRNKLDQTSLHRSKPEFRSKDKIEIEADKFAIYLLAPKKSFTEKLKNKNFNSETINELSDYFQISTYAACLHYIDLTDLACSLIINNRNGTIIYERRSKQFINGFYHQFLYKQKIPSGTHTYDFVNGISSDKSEEIELNSWYPDLKNKITATENILELGYNNFVLTLIEPHKSSDEENY